MRRRRLSHVAGKVGMRDAFLQPVRKLLVDVASLCAQFDRSICRCCSETRRRGAAPEYPSQFGSKRLVVFYLPSVRGTEAR